MLNRLFLLISLLFLVSTSHSFAQQTASDSVLSSKIHGYQIHLKQPAKEIRLLMYEKTFLPVHGRLSEDRKSIIMDDYEKGSRVHVRVIYEDGTADEFVRSPCYIDPVIEAL
jgi:hypothetical protein